MIGRSITHDGKPRPLPQPSLVKSLRLSSNYIETTAPTTSLLKLRLPTVRATPPVPSYVPRPLTQNLSPPMKPALGMSLASMSQRHLPKASFMPSFCTATTTPSAQLYTGEKTAPHHNITGVALWRVPTAGNIGYNTLAMIICFRPLCSSLARSSPTAR